MWGVWSSWVECVPDSWPWACLGSRISLLIPRRCSPATWSNRPLYLSICADHNDCPKRPATHSPPPHSSHHHSSALSSYWQWSFVRVRAQSFGRLVSKPHSTTSGVSSAWIDLIKAVFNCSGSWGNQCFWARIFSRSARFWGNGLCYVKAASRMSAHY